MQPSGVVHVSSSSQRSALGTLEQLPPMHVSSVQSTWSLQSAALQQLVPHVAVPSAARQHLASSVQRGGFSQWPEMQRSSVQVSPSPHCESVQHSAQPWSPQQTVPVEQSSW
jgi:hypothetical protein